MHFIVYSQHLAQYFVVAFFHTKVISFASASNLVPSRYKPDVFHLKTLFKFEKNLFKYKEKCFFIMMKEVFSIG